MWLKRDYSNCINLSFRSSSFLLLAFFPENMLPNLDMFTQVSVHIEYVKWLIKKTDKVYKDWVHFSIVCLQIELSYLELVIYQEEIIIWLTTSRHVACWEQNLWQQCRLVTNVYFGGVYILSTLSEYTAENMISYSDN